MEPTLEGLPRYEEEFQVRDDTDCVVKSKWQWAPTIPTRNNNGVSGWALNERPVHSQARNVHGTFAPCATNRALQTRHRAHPGTRAQPDTQQASRVACASGGFRGCIVWCKGSRSPTWLCVRRLWL